MKPLQIITVCLIGVLVASCASRETSQAALEAARVRIYDSSPGEVLAAARAAMEEIGKDNDLMIWRDNDVSFLATIRQTEIIEISTNYVYYDFKTSEHENGTRAYLDLNQDSGNFVKVRFHGFKSQFMEFWALLEKNLGKTAIPKRQSSTKK